MDPAVKEAVRMIIAERGRQADIAESLAKLGEDAAVAAEMATVLKDVDASLIEAALIIRLQPLAGMTAVINGRLELAVWTIKRPRRRRPRSRRQAEADGDIRRLRRQWRGVGRRRRQ